ncbi:unnamed protein product [Diabrotica balteata]|uniref:WAP domain-containing protein n=1 Tax=Diabrotica balteata TaxID=107213 RepID=A0A9N9X6R6_DIABA|nr:unnamed protein product [Diabrotica balteata]
MNVSPISYLIVQCVKNCLSKGIPKPGFCPDKNTHISPFAENCMKTCERDSQCGGVAKCCPHGCGTMCQMVVNLDFVEVTIFPVVTFVCKGKITEVFQSVRWISGLS